MIIELIRCDYCGDQYIAFQRVSKCDECGELNFVRSGAGQTVLLLIGLVAASVLLAVYASSIVLSWFADKRGWTKATYLLSCMIAVLAMVGGKHLADAWEEPNLFVAAIVVNAIAIIYAMALAMDPSTDHEEEEEADDFDLMLSDEELQERNQAADQATYRRKAMLPRLLYWSSVLFCCGILWQLTQAGSGAAPGLIGLIACSVVVWLLAGRKLKKLKAAWGDDEAD